MGKSDKVSYGKILFFACLSLIVSACGSGDASGPEAQIVRVVDDEFLICFLTSFGNCSEQNYDANFPPCPSKTPNIEYY